jgi:hypothetical protein
MTSDLHVSQPASNRHVATQRGHRALREAGLFFALTFAISWGVGGAFLLLHAQLEPLFGPFGPRNAFFYVAGWAPTLSALILALAFEKLSGWKILLGRLVRPFRIEWLAVATLLIPALALLLMLALSVLPGYTSWPVTPHAILVLLPATLFGSAFILINTGPLGEELGWRGYALPRLLEKFTPLASALIIGLVWTIWHVPAFFLTGIMGPSSGFPWWALDTFALSIMMTWLFMRANGNVPVAGMVPHFVINGMGSVGAWLSRPPEATTLALVAICLVIFDWRRFLRTER